MLSKGQIEELGWVQAIEGTFLFESSTEEYINWVLKEEDDTVRIYGTRQVGDKLIPDYIRGYTGDIEDQMELYDIMQDFFIIPKENEDGHE